MTVLAANRGNSDVCAQGRLQQVAKSWGIRNRVGMEKKGLMTVFVIALLWAESRGKESSLVGVAKGGTVPAGLRVKLCHHHPPCSTAQVRSVPRAGGSATSSFTNTSKCHPKRAKEGAELG